MSETTPITDEERESARRHFMPGVMREFSGVMRSGSVMEAYEARLQAAEAEIERLKGALEAIDKKARNPKANQSVIAQALGVSRQYVSQVLQVKPAKEPERRECSERRYQLEVQWARRIIPERGRIWEGLFALAALGEAGQ